ncbi:helix-turn-helix transcriptional regulator [Selenomonas sp. AE3005]|uniref:helix-turn-helix domain-containing protein n=1 Tax=Selenomonas sp. AE3005 TaxID=1485543 RepID=UPI0025D870AA|nr:helix-turn-helix transcriptional regulator [Selenomonas sp. AE3005]
MEHGNIGQYIRARRLAMNLSQAALGHKIGKSSQVISNWERGFTKRVSVEELAKIAEVLDVDIRYFFPQSRKSVTSDKRLQAIITVYPQLSEHTKAIIDKAIREDFSMDI